MTTGQTRAWVVCAMSGGVDSTVTAALLQRAGYHVIGITMQLCPDEGAEGIKACCNALAVEDARRAAARLDIPHYVLNAQDDFQRYVIDDFIEEYRAGRTPNPCIRCNEWMKFDVLLRRARELGTDCVATGHYARVVHHDALGRWSIRRGVDARKDQSYALYGLTQEQLARALFPLGSMTKPETRALARELGLSVAEKPESQEICFIPDNDYGGFLREAVPDITRPGQIVDRHGSPLGTHEGVAFYTIGQRRRLDIRGSQPWFVIGLDAATNTVVVGAGEELFQRTAIASQVIFSKYPAEAFHAPRPVKAMVRYRMAAQPALAQFDGESLRVIFESPQRAITPGQSLVCYEGDDVVCGGIIITSHD